jgi:hypothetical protein
MDFALIEMILDSVKYESKWSLSGYENIVRERTAINDAALFKSGSIPFATYVDGFSLYLFDPKSTDWSGQPAPAPGLDYLVDFVNKIDASGATNRAVDVCKRSIEAYRRSGDPADGEAACLDCGAAVSATLGQGAGYSTSACIKKCWER